jgi:hypothetical protein
MGGKTQSVPSSTTQTTRAEIPQFLMPLLQSQVDTGVSSLSGLQSALANGLPNQQVAGFSQPQLQAHQLLQNQIANPSTGGMDAMRSLMSAPGGQAQGMLQRAMANPSGVYQNSLDGLKSIGQGEWINRMMPTFNGGIQNAINGQFVPGTATNTLDSFAANGYQLPGASQSALEQSASGGGLYGSAGFDEAVQASIRAAKPAIASTFAGAGSGGLKSGLAQIGMQQAASDAFARLYGDERNRQLSSASQLGSFGLAGRDQQISAANARGNLAVSEQGLRNQATLGLGGLMSQERDRQLQALQSAPGIGLMGINALNGMENQQQQMRMNQALALNGMENQQFNQGMAGIGALAGMGNQAQAQHQTILDAQRMNAMNPILAQQMMLAASQGIPVGSLMGQTSTGTANQQMFRNTGAGILGGAGMGLGLGAMTAAPGATGLAALGGPLGIGLAIGGGLLGGLL